MGENVDTRNTKNKSWKNVELKPFKGRDKFQNGIR
jgi:hypothetical protein